jgi:uncharacterized protein DUF1840
MYRFKSKADGDLIMLAPVGDQILRILGREPAPQGIIEAAALPQAIAALEQAIVAAERARGAGPDDDDDAGGAKAVGLRQRAWPMLEMMRRSLAERADIVWGV